MLLLSTLLATATVAATAISSDESWWHQMFSIAFDGHGNFVAPNLDTLNATAASLGPVGFHGIWDADLNRDTPWMRAHLAAFERHPGTKRVIYIEGCGSSRVLARAGPDGRVLFTSTMMEWLNDPERRDSVVKQIRPDGRTAWFGDWQFLQSHPLKTTLGSPLPTPAQFGLKPFIHPLTGLITTTEEEFWQTRSARALIGNAEEGVARYAPFSPGDAERLGLDAVTTRRDDGQWLVEYGDSMLYDAQFAPYQAAKARRAMDVFAPDMIHYDDWDLRSPTMFTAKADIHVAAFREFVRRRFSEEDCHALGFEKTNVADFDVLQYLLHPPWRSEYPGEGDGPQWRCAADPRWLSNRIWRAFQIACIEDRLASMREIHRLYRQASQEVLGRHVPMVANIIPTLGAIFLQRDCVDMSNFEWPAFKTYGAFPKPFGYYPEARLGIGPRMASKIGTTGHAIVDPYVEPQHSGWDGKGFTRRHGEALHKVICFDLVANRGIPAFALTWDGGYSPGSIHSAGQLHAFMNEVAPVVSRREYLAEIGLAASSWSTVAAQPPFGGWRHEVSKRHLAEFLGWAQYLASSRDFPQWDVIPFDDVSASALARFPLVILPSVLVIANAQIAALETYLKRGGKLLITGETGTFAGPDDFLLPRPANALADVIKHFPTQVAVIPEKPGLEYHLDRAKGERLRSLLKANGPQMPVIVTTNAPEHIGICASESLDHPGELTIDLVNYHHDLASDRLNPVTAQDFTIQLRSPRFAAGNNPTIEAIRFDESAPNNTARQALDPSDFQSADGIAATRVPPFGHYQILRFTISAANTLPP